MILRNFKKSDIVRGVATIGMLFPIYQETGLFTCLMLFGVSIYIEINNLGARNIHEILGAIIETITKLGKKP